MRKVKREEKEKEEEEEEEEEEKRIGKVNGKARAAIDTQSSWTREYSKPQPRGIKYTSVFVEFLRYDVVSNGETGNQARNIIADYRAKDGSDLCRLFAEYDEKYVLFLADILPFDLIFNLHSKTG